MLYTVIKLRGQKVSNTLIFILIKMTTQLSKINILKYTEAAAHYKDSNHTDTMQNNKLYVIYTMNTKHNKKQQVSCMVFKLTLSFCLTLLLLTYLLISCNIQPCQPTPPVKKGGAKFCCHICPEERRYQSSPYWCYIQCLHIFVVYLSVLKWHTYAYSKQPL